MCCSPSHVKGIAHVPALWDTKEWLLGEEACARWSVLRVDMAVGLARLWIRSGLQESFAGRV
jgi:hypothetical protein